MMYSMSVNYVVFFIPPYVVLELTVFTTLLSVQKDLYGCLVYTHKYM